MQDDERGRAEAVLSGITFDRRGVEDERLRLEVGELLLARLDEERLRKERMPGAVGDHAEREPVFRIGAREGVHDVDVVTLEMTEDLVAQTLEAILVEILVDLAPGDPLLAARLPDDVLVVRRAAGVHAGVDDERPALRKLSIPPLQRVHVEKRGGRMGENAARRLQAMLAQIDRAAYVLDDCHPLSFGSRREFPAR